MNVARNVPTPEEASARREPRGARGVSGPKERGIVFAGDSIRAIEADEKIESRRVILPQPGWPLNGFRSYPDMDGPGTCREIGPDYPDDDCDVRRSPFGVPGDILYVREAWAAHRSWDDTIPSKIEAPFGIYRRVDFVGREGPSTVRGRWRSARFMPKKFARIWLRVLSVRVEQLQQITPDGARAEGCPRCPDCENERYGRGSIEDRANNLMGGKPWLMCHGICDAKTELEWFETLWDSKNEKRGYPWLSNPWVWVLRFERTEPS